MSKQRLSRRDFLKVAGASAAAAVVGPGQLSASSAAAAPQRQEPVEITFMGWGGVEEDEGVRAAVEVFQQEQSAVRVKWMHVPDNYYETLLANIAAGTPPDTAFVSQNDYLTYVHDGLTVDITDYLTNDELLGQEDYFIQPQETQHSADANGRWHGIGSCWTVMHIYYNAALFEEAGIEPPDFTEDKIYDWDQFVEVARQLTVDANGRHPGDEGFDVENVEQWGVHWPSDWWLPLDAMVTVNGGTFTKDGLLTLDQPEALEGIQRVADLMFVHQVMPQTALFQALGMSNTQMLDTGRLAMAVEGSWALAWMYKMEAPLGLGPLPKMSTIVASAQAHFHSMIKGTEHPDEAWQWLRFLATPFYQTQFCRMGLWMPNQTALLTEEGLATWLNDEVHTPNFRQFATEYVPAYMRPIVLVAGWPKASAFVMPAVESVMNGNARAEDALPDAVAQGNALITEEYLNA